MWHASPLRKVQGCRRWASDSDVATLPLVVAPRTVDGHTEGVSVGVGGLRVCGSWHSCMTCGAKIAVHRARELEHVFKIWDKLGNSVVQVVFSARHHRDQLLEYLVKGMRSGWKGVTSTRPWAEDRARLGVEWYIRCFETTDGDEHGWHPHYHVFFLVNGKIGEGTAKALCAPMWNRWRAGLARRGMTAVASVKRGGETEQAGFSVTVMDTSTGAGKMGRYPFKMALEAVGGVFKRGRGTDKEGRSRGHRHRTPFEVMECYAAAVAEGDEVDAAADLARIHEWSNTATKMRFRQAPFPPGMREWFAQMAKELRIPGPLLESVDMSDEERDQLAAESEAEDAVTAAHMPKGAWLGAVAYELDTLRAAGRMGGFPAVVAWFDQRRIPLELTVHGETLLGDGRGP